METEYFNLIKGLSTKLSKNVQELFRSVAKEVKFGKNGASSRSVSEQKRFYVAVVQLRWLRAAS